MRNLKWLLDENVFLIFLPTIITIIVLITILSGCCFFKHAPIVPSVPEVQTITNTVIKQVKVNDWLVTGSILLMGIGVFGFLNGMKQGISLIAAAGVVLGISLILKAYGAILVFAGAVCIAGYVGWQIWIRVRALYEVVENVENIKTQTAVSDTVDLKTVLSRQSPSTKSLVAGIRAKL